jgi:hypothetical protein
MLASRRALAPVAVFLLAITLLWSAPPATAATDPPSVRLFAANSKLTVERNKHDYVWFDPGTWIASVGGGFEIRASRPDYDTPVTLVQTDPATGAALRTLDPAMLDGWVGLSKFVRYTVTDVDGNRVLRGSTPFCPSTWNRARLNDQGPINSRYPYLCGGGPFTKGTVWGIDDGWASSAMGDYYSYLAFRAERRHYTLRMWIDPAYVTAFDIAPEDAEAVVHVSAVPRGSFDEPASAAPARTDAPAPSVPTVSDPDPSTLPDLVALPAWGMGTYTRKQRDYLSFNATEWNAGPGTMVVEGFRPPDADEMDAYQYFYAGGEPVGRASIGTMEYHAGGGHDHWHFEQFTQYSLLDASQSQIVVSEKQSWCLANTDPIDLNVPNAKWDAYGGGLYTACGGPGALWVREVLDVGWGDTYSQWVAGQAFDITDLPNGTYYVEVAVNPLGAMFETSTENNVELREIQLTGKPGHRKVTVPPWHGIDTEVCWYYCY